MVWKEYNPLVLYVIQPATPFLSPQTEDAPTLTFDCNKMISLKSASSCLAGDHLVSSIKLLMSRVARCNGHHNADLELVLYELRLKTDSLQAQKHSNQPRCLHLGQRQHCRHCAQFRCGCPLPLFLHCKLLSGYTVASWLTDTSTRPDMHLPLPHPLLLKLGLSGGRCAGSLCRHLKMTWSRTCSPRRRYLLLQGLARYTCTLTAPKVPVVSQKFPSFVSMIFIQRSSKLQVKDLSPGCAGSSRHGSSWRHCRSLCTACNFCPGCCWF